MLILNVLKYLNQSQFKEKMLEKYSKKDIQFRNKILGKSNIEIKKPKIKLIF